MLLVIKQGFRISGSLVSTVTVVTFTLLPTKWDAEFWGLYSTPFHYVVTIILLWFLFRVIPLYAVTDNDEISEISENKLQFQRKSPKFLGKSKLLL